MMEVTTKFITSWIDHRAASVVELNCSQFMKLCFWFVSERLLEIDLLWKKLIKLRLGFNLSIKLCVVRVIEECSIEDDRR